MPQANIVRWLVIGIGDITTKRVIPAILAEPRSELRALLTRDPRKADSYPGATVCTDLDTALLDPDIDAVYVASPVALHAAQTIASLKAGKHVLCEKPVAMNYAEAQSMVEAGNASGKTFGVSYFRRLFPKLLRTRQLIDEGVIGQPVLGEAQFHGWLESEARAWLRDPALSGGGPLFDTGSHRIDAFNFLFGPPIDAAGLRSNAVHLMPVEDSASVLIAYQEGIRAIVDVRWNSHVVRDRFRIVGAEGDIDLDPLSGPLLRYAGKEEQWPTHANVHFPLVENFVNAVLDGTPLACPAVEAIQTDRVTAAVLAERSGPFHT